MCNAVLAAHDKFIKHLYTTKQSRSKLIDVFAMERKIYVSNRQSAN